MTTTSGVTRLSVNVDHVATVREARRVLEPSPVAAATLAANRVIRGTMTALLWMWRPPMPCRVAATPEDAVAYCLTALAEAGVPLRMSEDDTRRMALSALS